jgi:ring-1,2-phenylacetyl-CoA epoxidase subunit PaaE
MSNRSIETGDDQAPLRGLYRRSAAAGPTLAVFAAGLVAYAGAIGAALLGHIPAWLAIVVCAAAAYALYTPMHEAVHGLVSENRALNNWIGRIAGLPLSILPGGYCMYRFAHLHHHRHTNEGHDKDPDAWCGRGRAWTLPLRWAAVDFKYLVFYWRAFGERHRLEKREVVVSALLVGGAAAGLVAFGHGLSLLLFWVAPARIALFLLAWSFDYLPHRPYRVTARDNPWQATNNRLGLEWLLSPLLLGQNYHLVHHLYPALPFYRYRRAWRARERHHLAQRPALVSALGRDLDTGATPPPAEPGQGART